LDLEFWILDLDLIRKIKYCNKMKPSKQNNIRILGVDPGFGRIGFGIIEKKKNGEWKLVSYGCIKTSAEEPFVDRLRDLYEKLNIIIKKYHPSRAVVEDLFFAKNVKTAMKVSHARGVILFTLAQAGLKVIELTPLQIKQAVTGYGRAEKRQVKKMVQLILNEKKLTQDDAIDALAAALAGDRVTIMNK
jgi:crossover junction endodeoxyribonuclease RuvC